MTLKKQKRFPLNQSDFKNMVEGNYYLIDKTMLIHHLIVDSSDIILFPRPRRFGKTCNLSMLRYFFEKSEPSNAHLFNGLSIRRRDTWHEQGKYPVIYITLKDVKGKNWNSAFEMMKLSLSEEFQRHDYLLKSDILSSQQKNIFTSILDLSANPSLYSISLKYLSQYLYQYYKKQVVILCDEYDTPIHEGYLNHYYNDVIEFMKLLLGTAYKDNKCLYKGVLTGILRVARESIFSDMNNIDVYSVLREKFSQFFGITFDEVQSILKDYNLTHHLSLITQEYDGYKFGQETIFNPWSLLHYCADPHEGTIPYWINTSGNALIRQLIFEQHLLKISDIESLIKGQPVWKMINENLVMNELQTFRDAVWNLLLFSGYLTVTDKRIPSDQSKNYFCCLKIPNAEVKRYFVSELEAIKTNQDIHLIKETENKQFKTLFISYNHNDQVFVNQLKKDLEKANISLIIDTVSMKFGEDIKDFIEKSIQSSDITLSIISENSLKSPWVMLETLETLHNENFLKRMRYIPVVIDHEYKSPSFASKLIEQVEKNIDLIVDEIARLSKKYVSTEMLNIQKERLIILRSNIDHILQQLEKRLIADFSSQNDYNENFKRLIQSIQQI